MGVKKLRPITPGQRFRTAPDFSGLTKKRPEKSLLVSIKRTGGRNNTGKMTMRYRGGGHKKQLRIIDFRRKKYDVPAVVKAIEYDPMRTAYIALLYYVDGEKAYILAPEGLKVGDKVVAGAEVAPEVGNALPLKAMPTGTIVHNIELHPGRGGAMARGAGAYAQLLAKAEKYVTLKLPSGERRMVLGTCMATVGTVSNSDHMNATIGKAGRSRWLGRRPRVRGVAMNPVDHPMGGGEGKASGGHPRSRTGVYAKGQRTRNKKKYSQKLIISRRKK
ncbi:MAG: 50S ribosomal protein L2 [Bacteroidota bacterium]